ncbi:MAG: DUF1285 domain-containing protein [Desulfomonilia bacterium]|nr:DUF1285 domain-containing protein [Desulfomonilia bacterium]
MKPSELRDVTDSCRIRIDKEGTWYYENQEIVNPLVLLTFCNALQKDEEGRYRIVFQSEVCYVDVEDTPFVVASIRGDQETELLVLLNTGETHKLDPATLSVGEQNVMYCLLPDGMKVRFSRAAYYLLALMMEEDEEGNIVLRMGESTYRVCSPHSGGE